MNSLSVLRTHFERALLNWLRSDITLPFSNSKHQTVTTLYCCVQELASNIEPHERYWPYAKTVLHYLLENQLSDQIACRKFAAQINLLLAQKIQQPSYLADKNLWQETVTLKLSAEQKTKSITAISNAFLCDAENCLRYLNPANINWHTKTIKTAHHHAQTMQALATEINSRPLIALAHTLESLFATLQQVSAASINEFEHHALKTMHQSLHSLLHQAAAGTAPKQDDLFIKALFTCEQAIATRLSAQTEQ